MSVLTSQPRGAAPQAGGVEVPDGSGFSQPRDDTTAALPASEETPDAASAPEVTAPEPDDLASLQDGDTETAAQPETGEAAGALSAPAEGDGAAGVNVDSEDPVLPVPQAVAPELPRSEEDLSISTDPAQPALPDVSDEAAAFPEPQEEPQDMSDEAEMSGEATTNSVSEPQTVPEPESAPETETAQAEAVQAPEPESAEMAEPEAAPETEPQQETAEVQPTEPKAESDPDPEAMAAQDAESEEGGASVAMTEPVEDADREADTLAAAQPEPEAQAEPESSETSAPETSDTAAAQETAEADAAQEAAASSTVGDLAPEVTTNRLPTVGEEAEEQVAAVEEAEPTESVEAAESAEDDRPPLVRFAAPFENPDGKPLMAIVLMDDGTSPVGIEALASFPYPLSFAVNAGWNGAEDAMIKYRAAGFEVLALADLPEEAGARDAEQALQAIFSAVPEAVAVMEGTGTGLQSSRSATEQLAPILLDSGHGAVLFPKGLNTAQKLLAREGVPSAAVFRDFDAKGQGATVIRRFLDQAAFKAGQEEGGVVMVGRLRPDTVSALLLWGLQDRASRVALAPISALLTGPSP